MKKKSTILAGLLMAVVVTGYSVAGTYARYTKDLGGATNEGTVAKWNVSLKDTAAKGFELFKTNANNATADGLVAPGGVETANFELNVTDLEKNDTQVEVDLGVSATASSIVKLDVSTAGLTSDETALLTDTKLSSVITVEDGVTYYTPIQFKVNGGSAVHTLTDLQTELNKVTLGSTNTVEWTWAMDGEDLGLDADTDKTLIALIDKLDTKLGEAGTAKVSISTSVVATQGTVA